MRFEALTTARLTIRRLRPEDLEPLVAVRSDPEVVRYTPVRGFDRERGERLIAEMAELDPGAPGRWFQFALERRDTGAFVGDLGLKGAESAHAPRTFEIGFTLGTAHHGQGLGTEAVRAVVDHAFRELGAHRVYGNCDARNVRSAALMARVGMRLEAHHREDWLHVELDGQSVWTDSLIYAILAREWLREG